MHGSLPIVGSSRRQLKAEVEKLKQTNEAIQENLRLRNEVDTLKAEIEKLNRPVVLTVEEVRAIMRYGINKSYSFAKDLKKLGCPVIEYGREIRIPTEGFLYWLNNGGGKLLEKDTRLSG